MKRTISNNIPDKGQILSVVVVVVGVVFMGTLILIGGAQLYFQTAKYSVDSEKVTAIAEAGIDKALASLNKTAGSYNGESDTPFGDGTYSVTITSVNPSTKTVESKAYIPNKVSPRVRKTIKVEASSGTGIAFVYGVQVGEGGLQMGNSNVVQGSIYSNGSITGQNTNRITGDAWVAGAPQPSPDQSTDCSGINCQDFIFGKTVSGDTRLDMAQSFKTSVSKNLNHAVIKIKKFGSPADVIVRIVKDKNGVPDKSPGSVLATGTLYSNLVSTSYSWINITFDNAPALTLNTTYWLLLDTASDNNNYWSWQNDLGQSYTQGMPMWSPNWQASNPSWNVFTGDLSFQIYLVGAANKIDGGNNFTIGGDAHANTLEDLTIQGSAYYQTIINSTAAKLYPNSADPPSRVFPISDANIQDWKNLAQSNGVSQGNISNCVSTLTSEKIVGNVNLGSNCTVTVKSPIWITGSLILNSNNLLQLSQEYSGASGVILVDGTVTLTSNNRLQGTGVPGSILMILSNYDSRSNNLAAITVNSAGNTGVLYANNGIIEPGNNNSFKELTAWGIRIINNSIINYESGLSSTLFSSGPSGSFSIIKGTYQIK